ncbi:MAG: hypothetical protein ABJ327_26860 [Litoreibacter sp.]
MKHGKIAADQITIACPEMAIDAVILPHLSLLLDLVSNVELVVSNENNIEGIPTPSIQLGRDEMKAPRYISECVAVLSFQIYTSTEYTTPNGWIAGTSQDAETPENQLAARYFETLPKLHMSGTHQRIETAQRAGLALVLPDIVARRDPKLRILSENAPRINLPVWMSVDRNAATIEGLHKAVVWARSCIDENQWLNDPIAQPFRPKLAK